MLRLLPTGLLVLSLGWSAAQGQEAPARPSPKKPAESLDGPPIVSAKAWAIADGKTGKVLWSAGEQATRAMASTTKIMTAWIVLDLAARNPAVLEETITFSARADKTGGSTAGILAGERLLVRDLLYGLLLPSGNDAAVGLAEHFGGRLAGAEARDAGDDKADSLELFVAEMNRRAKELKLTRTRYFDPHGNGKNHSSAGDLIVLAWNALQNPLFRNYVQTRRHECDALDAAGKKRHVVWQNTNHLLEIEGYDGVKTGTTGAAGACLVASGRHGDSHLLVVVLGCSSSDGRYVDSRNLFRWAWRQRQPLSGEDGGKE